ncbi:hypothetical protein [Rhizobium laguerreae]|uniref:Uncharacterized protein n=1 Tax=Rhizobium laguerreae TaxID=1076926 RepID=A0A7Y2R4T7_9HYPH|nr:hypothetical protein [Rhizobium laguerreae]NNH64331.1 hypothetical protein [Rhizobium laguerreae]
MDHEANLSAGRGEWFVYNRFCQAVPAEGARGKLSKSDVVAAGRRKEATKLKIKILASTYNATFVGESPFDAENAALRARFLNHIRKEIGGDPIGPPLHLYLGGAD